DPDPGIIPLRAGAAAGLCRLRRDPGMSGRADRPAGLARFLVRSAHRAAAYRRYFLFLITRHRLWFPARRARDKKELIDDRGLHTWRCGSDGSAQLVLDAIAGRRLCA